MVRRWTKIALPVLAAALVGAVALTVASSGGAPATPPVERLDKVVLLGDSYSAGNGAGAPPRGGGDHGPFRGFAPAAGHGG